jgi:hypothetical protein
MRKCVANDERGRNDERRELAKSLPIHAVWKCTAKESNLQPFASIFGGAAVTHRQSSTSTRPNKARSAQSAPETRAEMLSER